MMLPRVISDSAAGQLWKLQSYAALARPLRRNFSGMSALAPEGRTETALGLTINEQRHRAVGTAEQPRTTDVRDGLRGGRYLNGTVNGLVDCTVERATCVAKPTKATMSYGWSSSVEACGDVGALPKLWLSAARRLLFALAVIWREAWAFVFDRCHQLTLPLELADPCPVRRRTFSASELPPCFPRLFEHFGC